MNPKVKEWIVAVLLVCVGFYYGASFVAEVFL